MIRRTTFSRIFSKCAPGKDEFLEQFGALAQSIRLGDPLDSEAEMGPLTSQVHFDRVMRYVETVEPAGRILSGGRRPAGDHFRNGYFIEPTIVSAPQDHPICQEEVFGPFVSICTFQTDEEAVEIANGTRYGLGAGLWTRDLQRAHQIGGRLRAGMIWVNCCKRVHPASPFGGTGESGYGREMGFEAMHEYTQPKSVWVNLGAASPAFYRR